MTLPEAISTGIPYRRGHGWWMKSENPQWPIRYVQSGVPYSMTEEDIMADNWEIEIRSAEGKWIWIYKFKEWQDLDKEKK